MDDLGGRRRGRARSHTDVQPRRGRGLPLGRTTVTRTVQDSAGATDTESFEVKVVDTTAPTLGPLPDDMTVTTSDPTGRTVTFTTPTASDVVDESPSVTCAPTNGDHFDVGRTPVTCTAADSEATPARPVLRHRRLRAPAARSHGVRGLAGARRWREFLVRGQPWPHDPCEGESLRRWSRAIIG